MRLMTFSTAVAVAQPQDPSQAPLHLFFRESQGKTQLWGKTTWYMTVTSSPAVSPVPLATIWGGCRAASGTVTEPIHHGLALGHGFHSQLGAQEGAVRVGATPEWTSWELGAHQVGAAP